jgi:hypothetical protein
MPGNGDTSERNAYARWKTIVANERIAVRHVDLKLSTRYDEFVEAQPKLRASTVFEPNRIVR